MRMPAMCYRKSPLSPGAGGLSRSRHVHPPKPQPHCSPDPQGDARGCISCTPCRVSPPAVGLGRLGGVSVALCSGRAECHRPPRLLGPSSHGPARGQLQVAHLLLVESVEEGVLQGGEVVTPIPHHTCGRRGRGDREAAARAGTPPPCPPVPPITFPHEASLAVVHDLGGNEGVVDHGVVPHGGEAAVLLQGSQRLRSQRAAQEGAEPLHRATQVLRRRGRSALGQPAETGTGTRTRAHLVELLVGDVEDVQELPLGQPALDVVKPGAVVHWGGGGGV